MEKSLRCVMCGTAGWEWEHDRFAYEPVEKFCPGCYAKDFMAQDASSGPGRTVELLPTHGVDAARRHVAAEKKARR